MHTLTDVDIWLGSVHRKPQIIGRFSKSVWLKLGVVTSPPPPCFVTWEPPPNSNPMLSHTSALWSVAQRRCR